MRRLFRVTIATTLVLAMTASPALAMHSMPMTPMPTTPMPTMPSNGTTMAPMPSAPTTMAPMPSTPTTIVPMMMDGMLMMMDGSAMPVMGMEGMNMMMDGMVMMPMSSMIMMDDDMMMPVSAIPMDTMMMMDGITMPMSSMMMDGMMMMPMDGMMMMPMDPAMPMDPSMPSSMPMDPSMPSSMPMDPSMPSSMPMDPGMNMGDMPTAMVTRDAGGDRIASAIRISRSQFETGTVGAAVLVNGYSYAEAIVAPALAGALDAPILLSRADGVSSAVIDELDRLGVDRVYIVGGVTSMSDAARRDLVEAGFAVSRIAGANRYATAAAVARKVSALRGGLQRAFVINADSSYAPYAAITVAPYAYSQGIPVLFTSNAGAPSITTSTIRTYGIDNVTVVGGTSSVSAPVMANLTRTTAGGSDNRVSGATRFEIARNLAQYALARGWADPNHVGLVNGSTGFGEGLAGGAATGSRNGVSLMVTRTEVPRPTELFLTQYSEAADIDGVHLFGGTSLISDAVMDSVMELGLAHGDEVDTPSGDDHSH